jgi:valyl-tRNA synthetase
MPRDEFRKLCREEAAKVEEEYANRAFKGLGHSHDWNLLYTTIDPDAQKISQLAFLQLVKQGDAYRAEEPVLWCPYHQTALAQAEVENKPRTTVLNYLYFDLEDGGKIEIATTRPEFLPACVGVFVHPNDKRYKKLVGKNAIVPLFNLKVPIITDDNVDMEFGSGILMVCTFGDTADIEKWKKHKLPMRICITEDGKLNELGGKYKGLKMEEAKETIKKDLDREGYIIKEECLEQEVGMCWRCKTPIEYMIAKQWFI